MRKIAIFLFGLSVDRTSTMQTGKSERRGQSVSVRNELCSVFVFDYGTKPIIAIVIIYSARSVDLCWMFFQMILCSRRLEFYWRCVVISNDLNVVLLVYATYRRVVFRYSLRRVQLHLNLFDIISFNL